MKILTLVGEGICSNRCVPRPTLYLSPSWPHTFSVGPDLCLDVTRNLEGQLTRVTRDLEPTAATAAGEKLDAAT